MGGLVLYRAPAAASPFAFTSGPTPLTPGKSSAMFAGDGAKGMISLSHTRVSTSQERVYAEVRMVADAASRPGLRAPISMAVVLDTSGSMSGDKIEDARRSVLDLIQNMRDDDEIAFVRYSDTSELVQPLARVGDVRTSLTRRIRQLNADGGTNIPAGLQKGLSALDGAREGRVKRIVLVSDGLDGTRAQAENLARRSFSSGITVSSLGIGLDFDESYMGSLARNGHGNFAFVNEKESVAAFLKHELDETATTTIENAKVTLALGNAVRFVSATGADATRNDDGSVTLTIGSMFAGDERRVIVELDVSGASDVTGSAKWTRVGAGNVVAHAPTLSMQTGTLAEVEAGRDGAVFASAVSVISSKRQVEAAAAYAAGDSAKAARIVTDNEEALGAAIQAAPAGIATALSAQQKEYGQQKSGFLRVSPKSDEGRAAAKTSTAKEMKNLDRKAW